MRKNSVVIASAASLIVSGCVSAPTKPILSPDGTIEAWQRPAGQPPIVASLRIMFEADVRDALIHRSDPARTETMMRSGYSLIYANCSTFFRSAGRNQRRMGVMRDLLAPIAAVLTGVLALQDFKDHPGQKEDLLSIITLGSNAATASLNIYDARFLFAAENIDSVRELTLKALWADRNATAQRAQGMRFEDGLIALFDNEAICSPAHILTLVRQAIKTAEPYATNAPAPPPDRPQPGATSAPLSGDRATIEVR